MYAPTAFWALSTLLAANTAWCQQTCHKYVIVSARGTDEAQGPSAGFTGMISTTLSALTQGIEYDLVYPASISLGSSAIDGSQALTRYISSGVSSCPDQQYAILGYSQGASVAALALANFTDESSAAFKAIRAVVVIGNPGHKPGADANVDQSGGDSTRSYPGSLASNAALVIPNAYYTSNKVLDICYQADPICAPDYPNTTFVPAHTLYGITNSVQTLGYDFLARALNTTPSNTAGNNPSDTSGTSPTKTGAATSVLPRGLMTIVVSAILTLAISIFNA